MLNLLILFAFLFTPNYGDLLVQRENKSATTEKPLSVPCCAVPGVGKPLNLTPCSNPKLQGPCDDVECVFKESGFLTDEQTLNKEAYRSHLKKFEENYKEWSIAVDKAINDCIDTEPLHRLKYPCKAFDVFACTGLTMLKNCPETEWKC